MSLSVKIDIPRDSLSFQSLLYALSFSARNFARNAMIFY